MPQESDLWSIAAGRWKLLGACMLAGIVVAVTLILVLPRLYRVQTTVITVRTDSPTSAQSGVARSLASIVGVGLSQDDVREEALALLRSDRLAWEFLTAHKLVEILTEGEEISDDDLRGTVVGTFKNSILSVQDDRRTGLITISMLWRDRQQAAEWTNAYVRLADDELRAQTLKDSENTLDLLQGELEQTNVIEIRNAVNRFYETQLQRMIFARARDSFALRTIDPAIAPAESDTAAPNKTLIIASCVILATLAGLFLAIMGETSRFRFPLFGKRGAWPWVVRCRSRCPCGFSDRLWWRSPRHTSIAHERHRPASAVHRARERHGASLCEHGQCRLLDGVRCLLRGHLFVLVAVYRRHGHIDLFSPVIGIPVLLLLYSWGSGLFVDATGRTPFDDSIADSTRVIFYVCGLLGVAGFMAGAITAQRVGLLRFRVGGDPSLVSPSWYLVAGVIGLAWAVIFIDDVFPRFNFMAVESYYDTAFASRVDRMEDLTAGVREVFTIYPAVVLLISFAVIAILKKDAPLPIKAIAAVILGAYFARNALAGSRQTVVQALILLAMYYHYHIKAVRPVATALAGAGLYLFVNLITVARRTAEPLEMLRYVVTYLTDVGASGLGLAASGELVTGANLHKLIEGLNSGLSDYMYGRNVINEILVFVPRVLYPDRPNSMAEEFVAQFYPGVLEAGGGYGFFILQEGYWMLRPAGHHHRDVPLWFWARKALSLVLAQLAQQSGDGLVRLAVLPTRGQRRERGDGFVAASLAVPRVSPVVPLVVPREGRQIDRGTARLDLQVNVLWIYSSAVS